MFLLIDFHFQTILSKNCFCLFFFFFPKQSILRFVVFLLFVERIRKRQFRRLNEYPFNFRSYLCYLSYQQEDNGTYFRAHRMLSKFYVTFAVICWLPRKLVCLQQFEQFSHLLSLSKERCLLTKEDCINVTEIHKLS